MTIDDRQTQEPTLDQAGPTADDVASLADRMFESGVAAFDVLDLPRRPPWLVPIPCRQRPSDRGGAGSRYRHRGAVCQGVARATVGRRVCAGEPSGATHRFWLSSSATEVFTDTTSLSYLAPLAKFVGAVGVQLHGLADAYTDGRRSQLGGFGQMRGSPRRT